MMYSISNTNIFKFILLISLSIWYFDLRIHSYIHTYSSLYLHIISIIWCLKFSTTYDQDQFSSLFILASNKELHFSIISFSAHVLVIGSNISKCICFWLHGDNKFDKYMKTDSMALILQIQGLYINISSIRRLSKIVVFLYSDIKLNLWENKKGSSCKKTASNKNI